MVWQIEITNTAKKQLIKLDRQVQSEILRYLRERICTNEDPRRYGAPLRRELTGRWKYRVGAYRLICEIQDEKILVLLLMVGNGIKIYNKNSFNINQNLI